MNFDTQAKSLKQRLDPLKSCRYMTISDQPARKSDQELYFSLNLHDQKQSQSRPLIQHRKPVSQCDFVKENLVTAEAQKPKELIAQTSRPSRLQSGVISKIIPSGHSFPGLTHTTSPILKIKKRTRQPVRGSFQHIPMVIKESAVRGLESGNVAVEQKWSRNIRKPLETYPCSIRALESVPKEM